MFGKKWHDHDDKLSYRAKVTVFYIHVYLQATCEMVKYCASVIHGDPRAKQGKTAMHSWWWPVP